DDRDPADAEASHSHAGGRISHRGDQIPSADHDQQRGDRLFPGCDEGCARGHDALPWGGVGDGDGTRKAHDEGVMFAACGFADQALTLPDSRSRKRHGTLPRLRWRIDLRAVELDVSLLRLGLHYMLL